MGEGKHPTKPTCVIKALRPAALLPKFSLLKQSMAQLDHLFPKAKKPMLVTTVPSSSKVTSSIKPSVEHTSATQSTMLASAPLSSILSSSVPIAEALSVGDLADTSSLFSSQRDVKAAGIPLLEKGEAVVKEELSLVDLSYTTQGSLMAEQPRAPSASSLPPIPNLGAVALAQGGGPHLSGNHFIPVSHANSSALMSGLAASHPDPSLMTDAGPSYTLASTCSDAEPSAVEPRVKLTSAMPSPVLSSVPLSTEFSSTVPITSNVSACEFNSSVAPGDPAEVAWFEDDFTPSHYRHLNPSLSYGFLPHSVLFSLGSWPPPPPAHPSAPTPLFFEALNKDALEPVLLDGARDVLQRQRWRTSLDLLHCCLNACASRSPSELVPLQRSCARLHLFLQQPDEALGLLRAQAVHQDDPLKGPLDPLTKQLWEEARTMILQQECGWPEQTFALKLP